MKETFGYVLSVSAVGNSISLKLSLSYFAIHFSNICVLIKTFTSAFCSILIKIARQLGIVVESEYKLGGL